MEVRCNFCLGSDRAIAAGLDHLQKRGVFVGAQLVDPVKEQHTAIGLAQKAGAFAARHAGARLPQQQDRRIRGRGDQFKPLGKRQHRGAGSFDTARQQSRMLTRGRLEPALQGVVAGQIKVDHIQRN